MRRADRGVTLFSLSFIDCMSCGLGAVVLLFMIIHHATQVRANERNREVASRVTSLEVEVLERMRTVETMTKAVETADREIAAATARAARLESDREQTTDAAARILPLRDEVRALERKVESLREEKGTATRSFAGAGDRQYLTGVRMGGRRVLILVDVSASMLSDTVVDILRRRNMAESQRRAAPKWRRALDAVDWITTQVPADALFQIYAFGTEARPVLEGTDGRWLPTDAGRRLTAAVEALRRLVPAGGTSLYQAFAVAGRLSPRPDNLYLVTDGLPTEGRSRAGRDLVSGDERLGFYREALRELPEEVPVNVILFPVEGDPLAGSAFWQLALRSGGALVSPARDWP